MLRTLGQGAFGRTYLARDHQSGRDVAIKMLDTRTVESWKAFELFEREAAVLRSVRHHGVPEIYDSIRAEWEGREAAFLVMEYVAGTPLTTLIEDRRHLDPAEASHLLLELLGVLDYLHGRVPPILHRDIKPANIILRPDGFPTLVDFGAVRTAIHPPGQGGSTIVGTYGYMPYEQHMGQASPASDLYALAATYLHLVTGRAPPEFMNPEGRIEVPNGLPGGDRLRQVLARMLRPSPPERYQTAREVRQALLASEDVASGRVLVAAAPRAVPAVIDLPPAPRTIEGPTAALLRRLAPSAIRTMIGASAPGQPEKIGAGAVVGFVVVGLITFGILPLIYLARSRMRRQRVIRFLQKGVPATAEIVTMQDTKDDLGQKLNRIRYQWEVDGQFHRHSEEVLASIADKWLVGDQIRILYLPDEEFDSLVISTA
ncbi:MAG: serine/threonine protein kinase [Gemmatimonadales bacterium]